MFLKSNFLPASGVTPPPDGLLDLDAPLQAALKALWHEGSAPNTARSYRSALRYWVAWHEARHSRPLSWPVSVSVVLGFIADHAQHRSAEGLLTTLPPETDAALVRAGFKGHVGPPSLNTLLHRVAVLSKVHQAADWPNPCQDAAVRALLSRVRKAYARRGVSPRKKEALTREPLEAVLATCDDSLRGRRDRALLLFAWASGGRRRAEVAAAHVQNLKRVGPEAFLYTLTHSKTQQDGRERPDDVKPLLGPAAQALQAWLDASGVVDGPVFRRVLKGGKIGAGLSAAAVRDIVRERCVQAGLEGDYGAHSLRSGFVTEAARQQVPLADTMALTGHRTVAAILGYHRQASALRNPAAQLLRPTGAEEPERGHG